MPNYDVDATDPRIKSCWVEAADASGGGEVHATLSSLHRGDWNCLACQNRNYAHRIVCNKCQTPREKTAAACISAPPDNIRQICGPTAGHVPVICNPTVAAVMPPELIANGGVFVDCTFGRGGHSAAMLSRLSQQGRLFAFDVDPSAVAVAKVLEQNDKRFRIIHRPFGDLAMAIPPGIMLSGVVMDLGVSSPQLDQAHRGFTSKGPLDLRMNQQAGHPASQWLSELSSREIAWIVREWGWGNDPLMGARIAESLVQWQATHGPFRDSSQFANVVGQFSGGLDERGEHPSKLTSHAIRMWLNQEAEQFEQVLEGAFERLMVGGRCVVICFKRSETEILSRFISAHEEPNPRTIDGWPQKKIFELYPVLMSSKTWCVHVMCNPILPTREEVLYNNRSRSASTHILEKKDRSLHLATLKESVTSSAMFSKPTWKPDFGGAKVLRELPEAPPAMGPEGAGCQYLNSVSCCKHGPHVMLPVQPPLSNGQQAETWESWLRTLDRSGALVRYCGILKDMSSSLPDLMRLYKNDDGELGPRFDVERFCNDIGLQKLAHRRIVERWASSQSVLGADDRWLGIGRCVTARKPANQQNSLG